MTEPKQPDPAPEPAQEPVPVPTIDPSAAPNLDALSAPEGSEVIDVNQDPVPGAPDPAPQSEEDLLDPEQDPAPHIHGDDLTKTMPEVKPSGEADPAPATDPTPDPQADPVPDPTPDPDPSPTTDEPWQDVLANFKTKMGLPEDFKVPETVTGENYVEFMQEVMQYAAEQQLHPDVLRIQKALGEGVEFDKIMQEYSTLSDVAKMPAEDLLKQHFKDVYKWDDAKIAENIESLNSRGAVDFEADKLRAEYSTQQAQAVENLQQTRAAETKAKTDLTNQQRTNQITESLTAINSLEDVYGMQINKVDKAEFADVFKTMVTPNEAGVAPLMEQLQSNENLVKVAYMLWKGDSKVRAAITDAKEGAKSDLLSKIDPKPRPKQGAGGGGPEPGQVDLDALTAPEGLQGPANPV